MANLQMGLLDSHKFPHVTLSFLIFLSFYLQVTRLLPSILLPGGLQCPEKSQDNDSTEQSCIHLTDIQQGAYLGPAFFAPLVIFGLVLSYFPEHYNRVYIAVLATLLVATIILAMKYQASFATMMILRILLGSVQSIFNPTLFSILSDLFEPLKRARTFAFYYVGAYVGAGSSYVSGLLVEHVGWRYSCLIWAAPGYLVAILLGVIVQEPQRGKHKGIAPETQDNDNETRSLINSKPETDEGTDTKANFMTMIRFTKSSKAFMLLTLASAVRHFAGISLFHWLGTFYKRYYDLGEGLYGPVIGVILAVGGSTGTLLGGYIADKLTHYTTASKTYVIAISQVIAAPFAIGVFVASNYHVSFVMLFFLFLLGEVWLGCSSAALQDVLEDRTRAQANAFYLSCNTLVGSCGPLIVGALSSHLSSMHNGHDSDSIRNALLYFIPGFYFLSGLLFALAGTAVSTDANAHRQYRSSISVEDSLPLSNEAQH